MSPPGSRSRAPGGGADLLARPIVGETNGAYAVGVTNTRIPRAPSAPTTAAGDPQLVADAGRGRSRTAQPGEVRGGRRGPLPLRDPVRRGGVRAVQPGGDRCPVPHGPQGRRRTCEGAGAAAVRRPLPGPRGPAAQAGDAHRRGTGTAGGD